MARALALTLVLLTAVLAAPASAAAKQRPRCPTKHAHTLAKGESGRIVITYDGFGGEYAAPARVLLCRRDGRRVRRLAFTEGVIVRVRLAQFTGRHVAFALDVSDEICSKYDPGAHC